jgi:hypothetical protein
MTPEQKAAYVQAQTAAMLCELESMKVANRERERRGEAYAYGEGEFFDLPAKYGVTHNQVVSFFTGV